MFRYKLTLAYDGTNYGGWQRQNNTISIQQHIQEVLLHIIHEKDVSIIGSGRTDAGVHARGQVAHFQTTRMCNPNRLRLALNGLLPPDIRVIYLEETSSDFHARYSAIRKEYHYHIYLERVMDPFRRLYCWHCLRNLNLQLLQEASALFIGTHDFTTFANKAYEGSAAHNAIRTIYRLDIVPTLGGLCLQFEGDGFLYKMVRNIVGTLVDAACGKIHITDIPLIFAAKDRRHASNAAPPQGLFLMSVTY